MTNPSNRTDVTDAMIEAGALAFAKLDSPYVRDIVTTIFTAMLTAQPQSGEVEQPNADVVEAMKNAKWLLEGIKRAGWVTQPAFGDEINLGLDRLSNALRSAQPVDQEEVREVLQSAREQILGFAHSRWSECEASDEEMVGEIDALLEKLEAKQ